MSERKPLTRQFYDRDPVLVAKELLGKTLVRKKGVAITSGRIVEVEAYLGRKDSASHSYRGIKPRNRSMFGPPGHAYVYAIHARYCMNVVTEPEGVPTAILIRAIEPLDGIHIMKRRRGCVRDTDATRGPARLCEAFGIDRELDGWDMTRPGRLWIASDSSWQIDELSIAVSPRIGVTSAREERLRFSVGGNPFVSGPKKHHLGESF